MNKWEDLGARIGAAIGNAVDALGLSDRIRAHYLAKYGACRVCAGPLGGPSPEQVCETCHAGEALGAVLGGGEGGDA